MSEHDYRSVELLRQCFREEDGRLYWRERPREQFASTRGFSVWNSRFAGKEAGYLNERKNGDKRWMVCFNYKMLLRYQIVWAMHTGEWCDELDHKDRDSLNDRPSNLRPATQSQNVANSRCRKNNKCGFKGVFWRAKTKKWQAWIKIGGRRKYLGQFDSPEKANAAYYAAARQHHGEFACAG